MASKSKHKKGHELKQASTKRVMSSKKQAQNAEASTASTKSRQAHFLCLITNRLDWTLQELWKHQTLPRETKKKTIHHRVVVIHSLKTQNSEWLNPLRNLAHINELYLNHIHIRWLNPPANPGNTRLNPDQNKNKNQVVSGVVP